MRLSKSFLVMLLIGLLTFMLASNSIGQQFRPVIEKVKDTGVLKIGCREAARPFAYVDEKGNMVGFSQDLAFLLAKKLEKRVGREVKVEQISFAGPARIAVLTTGKVDLEPGSSTHTAAREDVVDFSVPFFFTDTVFAVRKGEGIDSLEDLDGKIVGSMTGTTNLKALRKIIDKGVIDPQHLVIVETHAKGFLALQTEKVDAYFTDTSLLMGLKMAAKNPEDYEIILESIHTEPYGWMMREGDSDWRDFVNHFFFWTLQTKCTDELDTLSELGILSECRDPDFTIFDAVYDKWMGPESATPIPRTPDFNRYLELMQWPGVEEVWPTKG